MKTIIRALAPSLAILLTVLLLCGLLTSCGGAEESGTFSKVLIKHPERTSQDNPSEKGSIALPAESFNQMTATESAGLTVEVTISITAGAETIPFRLTNGENDAFNYGYRDILLQKKTENGWETYQRIDDVQEIGMSLKAGGATTGAIRPGQYGVMLQSGEIYRIAFANMPGEYGEFEVQ